MIDDLDDRVQVVRDHIYEMRECEVCLRDGCDGRTHDVGDRHGRSRYSTDEPI